MVKSRFGSSRYLWGWEKCPVLGRACFVRVLWTDGEHLVVCRRRTSHQSSAKQARKAAWAERSLNYCHEWKVLWSKLRVAVACDVTTVRRRWGRQLQQYNSSAHTASGHVEKAKWSQVPSNLVNLPEMQPKTNIPARTGIGVRDS